MFITKKISKRAAIAFLCVAAAVVFIIFRLCVCSQPEQTSAVSSLGAYDLSAGSTAEQIEFLNQFGWQTEKKPIETTTVKIPQVFGDVYERYNKIQLEQGLDLHDYEGEQCKRVSYRITNYPDTRQQVNANLLIYNGNVIGGDISSTRLGGFMHGFVLDGFTKEVKNDAAA